MISVKNLRENEGQWTFTVVENDGKFNSRTGEFEDAVFECETNERGNGLWQGGRQTDGTSQFSLSGYSKSGAYQKIRRRFTVV